MSSQTPRGVKMSELRDSSEGTRSAASVFAFSRRDKEHIARRASTLGIACAERRSKAQYVTRTRARESMSTYNYAEITLEKRNRKMRERAYSSEGRRSERTASIFLLRKGATARKPDRDASTPVSKTKSSHISVGFLFCNQMMNTRCRVRPRCRTRLAVT